LVQSIHDAKKQLGMVMVAVNSTKQEAIAANKAFRQAVRPVKRLKAKARMEVLFDVLEPAQRVKLLKCKKRSQRSPRNPGQHPGRRSPRQSKV
jgi:hypothetical protein